MKENHEGGKAVAQEHVTTPFYLTRPPSTHNDSRITTSSPALSQISVPHTQFLPCHFYLEVSQVSHTQKYRSDLLTPFLPSALQPWPFLLSSLSWYKMPMFPQSVAWETSDFSPHAYQNTGWVSIILPPWQFLCLPLSPVAAAMV